MVDDSTPTPVTIASGTGFTSGQSVSFLGVSVAVTGTPAANDSFGVTPAQHTDVFAMKVIEQRYFKQFNALDTMLAQMNTTATSLDSWLKQNKQS